MLWYRNKIVFVVGNQMKIVDTWEYHVPLSDAEGNVWIVRAFGMDEIASYMEAIDVTPVAGVSGCSK